MPRNMIRKKRPPEIGIDKNGMPIYWSWEREMDFYRRIGGATSLTVLRGPAKARQEPQDQPPGPEEPRLT